MAIAVRVRGIPKNIDYSVISRASAEIKKRCIDMNDAEQLILRAFAAQPWWRIGRRQRLLRISQYYVDQSMEILAQARKEENALQDH